MLCYYFYLIFLRKLCLSVRGKLGYAKNRKKLGLACFSKFEGFQWFEEMNGFFFDLTELVKRN